MHEWVGLVAGQIADGSVNVDDCRQLREEMLSEYRDGDGVLLPSTVKHMMLAEEDLEAANNAIPAALLREELNMEALNRPPPANSEIAMARLMGSDAVVPDLEQQVEQLRRAPTANNLALFLHSLLPWNDPNAPPPEDLMADEGLLAQARALLGIGVGHGEAGDPGNGNNNNNRANNNREDDWDDDWENPQDDSSHTDED